MGVRVGVGVRVRIGVGVRVAVGVRVRGRVRVPCPASLAALSAPRSSCTAFLG